MKLTTITPLFGILLVSAASGEGGNIRTGSGSSSFSSRGLGLVGDSFNFLGTAFSNLREGREWKTASDEQEKYEVVIIGAGMAGISAAVELQQHGRDVSYIILESTEKMGGRVRSATFGESGNEVVVEEGANWIFNNTDLPTWNLAEDLGLESTFTDFFDFELYDEFGTYVPFADYMMRLYELDDAYFAAADEADLIFEESEQPSYDDIGVVALLSNNGWSVAADASGNIDYVFQWVYIDAEYAEADTSIRYFPAIEDDNYFVHDQRGFSFLIESFADDNMDTSKIRYNTRVKSIAYDEDVCDGKVRFCNCCGTEYAAVVTTEDGTEILAKRVITTVSSGVLESGDINFSPSLKYSSDEYNPYKMGIFIKIFYQFDTKFWDDTEFVLIATEVDKRGHCNQWMDMDNLITDSKIIRCDIMTEAFNELKDVNDELNAAMLYDLLDPLRQAYEMIPDPVAISYAKHNLDQDFGYGSYANWQIGKTFTDFAKFFGGIELLTPYCDHNGCNSDDEWIMHFGGSASCYDSAETVHGAFFSGQRSALNVLRTLGFPGIESQTSCDDNWIFLDLS